MSIFSPAARTTVRARIAISGPSGSGKTWTALAVAQGLVGPGGRIAVADTERGSASLYAGDFGFDVAEMHPPFSTAKYLKAIAEAGSLGYDALIIDSLTHAWKGEGGVLDEVDAAKARNRGGNDFSAWKDGDKLWRSLLDAMLGAPLHIIATMRSKQEWVLEEDSRGKRVPRKVGMAPEARDGVEYEFTLVFDLDLDHRAVVSKSRCSALANAVIPTPGREVGETLAAWLSEGVEPSPAAAPGRHEKGTGADGAPAEAMPARAGDGASSHDAGRDAPEPAPAPQLSLAEGEQAEDGAPADAPEARAGSTAGGEADGAVQPPATYTREQLTALTKRELYPVCVEVGVPMKGTKAEVVDAILAVVGAGQPEPEPAAADGPAPFDPAPAERVAELEEAIGQAVEADPEWDPYGWLRGWASSWDADKGLEALSRRDCEDALAKLRSDGS